MKKVFYSTLFALLVTGITAQTSNIPNVMNLVAVVRDANGNPIVPPQQVDVKLEIATGALYQGGTLRYCEQVQNIAPNTQGEIAVQYGFPVGSNNNLLCTTGTTNSLTDGEWENGDTYYRLSWRITGQSNYTDIDSGFFASVPYAFASRTAETLVGNNNATDGQALTWNAAQQKWLPTTISSGGSLQAGAGISISGTNPVTITNTSLTVPVGTVVAYAGNVTTPPSGWMVCNGAVVSRAQYATLFAAIGNTWGSGDNSTTFSLPDLRGMFLRGVDGAAGKDPDKATRTANATGGNTGNNVGSVQEDAFQGHNHHLDYNNDSGGGADLNPGGNRIRLGYSQDGDGAKRFRAGAIISDITNGTPRIAKETRPKNAYVYYIIKY